MEDEGEALRSYCRRRISFLRERRQDRPKHTGSESRPPLPPDCTPARGRDRTSPDVACQGPGVQPVPPQLVSALRLKTAEERMRRAAEVELHEPAGCGLCEQEQASLALRGFIRRKETQLKYQTLKGRLNTHFNCGERWGSLCEISQSPSMPLSGFGRHYSVDICGSQQPEVALATAKERGVALATDEMRGYPDKNATGTHLASPRCPFSDR